MNRPLALSLLAGLLIAGAAHASDADHVKVGHAWIRVLPGDLPAGGYATLSNDSDRPVALEGASSVAYEQVMLHRSTVVNGVSRMAMVDNLTIPAHGKVALAPGGYHLMMMHADPPVKSGDTVQVTLRFADGSTLDADFKAMPANATGT